MMTQRQNLRQALRVSFNIALHILWALSLDLG
jgi:hypothetical protein